MYMNEYNNSINPNDAPFVRPPSDHFAMVGCVLLHILSAADRSDDGELCRLIGHKSAYPFGGISKKRGPKLEIAEGTEAKFQ
ncbi:hypothetical protein niasHT_025824 [Heterodera trifolii]|uniref:Effector protein n=1 Tax=Heterodera trifolii TaxID=157864 RepID=A0ABD2KEZ2_9BILA